MTMKVMQRFSLGVALLFTVLFVGVAGSAPLVNHKAEAWAVLKGQGTALTIKHLTTTANTKFFDLQDSTGTSVFSVDLEGDVLYAGTAAINTLANITTAGTVTGTTGIITGLAGTGTGYVSLGGTTGGIVTVQPQASFTSYNFNLPTSAGTAGQPLLSGGGTSAAQTYGTLGVAAGGTALTTLTAHAVYVGNGASAPTALTVGPTSSVLQGSTGADPAFTTTPTLTSVESQVIYHSAGTQTIANGSTTLAVAAGVGCIPVAGTGGVTLGGTPIITNGTTVGQKIIIIGTSNTNTLAVPDTGNVNTTGTITLGLGDTLSLIWDGAAWDELGTSNN